jgi:hypothetical protein
MHETRETFMTLVIVSCLAAGIGGAVFYTFGPDGWLVVRVRDALSDPSISALAVLLAIIGMLALAKRVLDRSFSSILNDLLVGAVGLGGLILLLQGARTVLN